jgi:acetyl esterase/lipase
MRLIEALREWYFDHETRTKIIAFLLFLVVLASLYVIVLKPPAPSDEGAALKITTPTPTLALSTTGLATDTPLPTSIIPTPTPAPPPIPLGPYQTTTQQNLPYGSVLNVNTRLDLCTPVGASGVRPGVILIHGGGFTGGDKISDEGLCSVLASYGFVAATVNYRLAPDNKWPAPLEDVQLAVRWLRANASTYNLDPQRLCSLGDSAGGHLAVFLGVLGTIYPGNEASLLTDQSPKVACVVDEFGPVDFTKLTTDAYWHPVLTQMFDQFALQTNPNILGQASPVYNVSAQSAPALVVQGIQDQTVPQSQSLELQRAYQQAGAPLTYISYTGGHEFSGLTPDQQEAINQQILTFLTDQENP